MKQRTGRFTRHARVTIRRGGNDSLEKSEHAADSALPIERGNHMHFRGSRVREANFDSPGDQRFD
jgi:hypothetical protein